MCEVRFILWFIQELRSERNFSLFVIDPALTCKDNSSPDLYSKIEIVPRSKHILSIYLNINQLDALNFIMSLFHASKYFEHMCSSSGGPASGIITLKQVNGFFSKITKIQFYKYEHIVAKFTHKFYY